MDQESEIERMRRLGEMCHCFGTEPYVNPIGRQFDCTSPAKAEPRDRVADLERTVDDLKNRCWWLEENGRNLAERVAELEDQVKKLIRVAELDGLMQKSLRRVAKLEKMLGRMEGDGK